MFKHLPVFPAVLSVGLLPAAGVHASDPCYGYDVSCQGDECTICWADDSDPDVIVCDSASKDEIDVVLPGCAGAPQVPGLVAPDGPRGPVLIDRGGRTTLPQTPAPLRDPGTPRQ